MRITVAGTGYVGLVTGVVLAEIGHDVTCVDVNEDKIQMMRAGKCPIFEEGLQELMIKNKERINYTTQYEAAYKNADVIYVGVGTPERADGSANLEYVMTACNQIAESLEHDCIVVIKSTVPIRTNDMIEKFLNEHVKKGIHVDVVSNPEFLSQGTAVHDTLYAARIILGVENEIAKKKMSKVYEPLTKEPYNQPILFMNRRSAEMVKYASNDFLALKISYINEIANFCETVGANVEDVSLGMGLDSRIGNKFLKPGIGYGGSCFPKDTKALHATSKELGMELLTVKSAIEVNKRQKHRLFDMVYNDFEGKLTGLRIACLGVTFKPGTDDLREAASIESIKILLDFGVKIMVYDPVGLENFKKIFGDSIVYHTNIDDTIRNADCCLIFTEWQEVKDYDINKFELLMHQPLVYDGRNCYSLSDVKKTNITYKSIGRPVINKKKLMIENVK